MHKMRYLAVMLAFVGCAASVASEQPLKRTTAPTEKKQVDSDDKNRATKATPNHTPDSAASMVSAAATRPVVTTNSNECEAKPDKNWWREFITDPIAIFTGLLATFTGLLAVATFFLWRSTKSLVLGAEKTAERQLRAYVSVESAIIENVQSGSTPVAYIKVKNFGQTPAYELTGTGGLAIGQSFDTLPAPTPTGTGQTRSSLPIGATTDQFHFSPISLTPEILGSLTDGSLTLWVYGEMRYRDTFGGCATFFL